MERLALAFPLPRLVRAAALGAAALALSLAWVGAGAAQDEDLQGQSQTAARGLFDLCRADAPDAAKVVEHGEVWGWPEFVGFLEHPDGYKREAGGESRRTFQSGDQSAYVEATIQSGEVTSAAPAHIDYFRCNVDSDQSVDADLTAYFTGLYGPPVSKTDEAVVWLKGPAEAGADAAASDDSLLKAVVAAGAGTQGLRVELTHEHGLDRAKLTLFVNGRAAAPPGGAG